MPHVVTSDSPNQNVTPVRLVVVGSRQPRRDGRLIRWGMYKQNLPDDIPVKYAMSIIGCRRAPGMTAKGVKWSLEQEEVRA